jgi:hypothetical protein
MSVRIQESSSGTRFLSFFTIDATDSGETFIDGDNDDVKELLTPVDDKLCSIGSIKYAFEFACVQ